MNAQLQKAVSRVVVREPFFASILLTLPILEDKGIPTFCTNGVSIKYNPEFSAKLSDEEVIGVLVHEVEHIAKLHPWRRQTRDPQAWNHATDYSINEELTKSGFTLPEGALIDPQFNGMAEEQIYSRLPVGGGGGGGGNNPGGGQGKGKGKGKGQPSGDGASFGEVEDAPGSPSDQAQSLERTKVEIFRAAMVAKQQGRLPAGMESWLENVRHPKASWQDVLRDKLTAIAKDDYSWMKANRRYLDTGFMLPSLYNFRCGTIAVVFDTSGSIGQTEVEQFAGELNSIVEAVKPERIVLMHCDAAVAHYEVLEGGQTLDGRIQIHGGGGTSFKPPFARLDEEGETPEALVYLTDGYGDFPDAAPDYPVIWAVTTDHEVPFGDRIQIDLQ